MKKLTSLVLASTFAVTAAFAQKTPVVGIVDSQRVLNDYADFQTAFEKVRATVAPVEEEMQQMQQNLQDIVTRGQEVETRAKNPAASDEARAEAQAELAGLQLELQQAQSSLNQFRQRAQLLAQQGQQQDLQPLQETAIKAVGDVAKEAGVDLVLGKKAVIYSSDTLEITDAVIAKLNGSE